MAHVHGLAATLPRSYTGSIILGSIILGGIILGSIILGSIILGSIILGSIILEVHTGRSTQVHTHTLLHTTP